MIRIKDESDFKNWFKKNYKKLGFSKIIKSDSMRFPDFVMLEKGKKVKVELEIKSSHFNLHKHNPKKVNKVICVIKDIKLDIPTIKVNGIRIISNEEKDSSYSIRNQIYKLFKKEKILTSSEVAKLLGISWNTAEINLLNLVVEGKVEEIKKEGVNLWIEK